MHKSVKNGQLKKASYGRIEIYLPQEDFVMPRGYTILEKEEDIDIKIRPVSNLRKRFQI